MKNTTILHIRNVFLRAASVITHPPPLITIKCFSFTPLMTVIIHIIHASVKDHERFIKRQCFNGSLMVFNGDKESPFTEHYSRCPIMS